jgi:RNA polymerase sigma-70 factor (ECF subfamily)
MQDYTAMDDATLVEHARHNTDAFGALYQRYLTPLYRYLLGKVGNSHDAEDLTMQIFTEVLDGLVHQRYREGGSFAAWLFTIARRRCIDLYRRHKPEPLDSLADPPSLEPGLLNQVENREQALQIARLIAGLDDERQELIRLRFSAGLSFAEIAKIEGKSEAAVKMAVYRALESLRAQWEVENG